MDLIEGLSKAFQQDAKALRDSIQAERKYCLDAFTTVRPTLVAALEDAEQALRDAVVPNRRPRAVAQYQEALRAVETCDSRIKALRDGIAGLSARAGAQG